MATSTTKPAKVKRDPVAVVKRVSDQMKAATLKGKLSKDELDSISNLALALKTFLG